MISTAKCCKLADPAPLEDDVRYVLRKAMRGRGMDAVTLSARSGIARQEVDAWLAGEGKETALSAMAAILGLHPQTLAELASYQPQVPHLHAVTRLQLPFEEENVNAWLIREEDQTLLFDTGFERDSIANLLAPLGVAEFQLFLTHDHRDHVGGLPGLRSMIRKHHVMEYGQTLRCGALEIRCIDLSGHCIPTYGYLIGGLSRSIFVVGDALFAGSIGGCADPFTYDMALRNLHHHVMNLPDDTILLPGHGPATTVGQEKRHNPFLAMA
jgi:hydroxyacylglutathione hydrolase